MSPSRLVSAFLPLALLLAGTAWASCSFCGSSAFGTCPFAKTHKHTDFGADKCMYCGSSAFGSCHLSPHGKHEHGYGRGKCRFCGSSAFGSCNLSPGGRHEH